MSADVTESVVETPPAKGGGRRGDGNDRARRAWSRARLALFGIALLLVASSPLWAPLLMRRMAFFRVRRVEILGARYVPAAELLARLHVDTMTSVWDPLDPMARRVETHAGVKHARVQRRLPGTLEVDVVERTPIALVPGATGLRAYDDGGVLLPVDPTHAPVDAPVLDRPDPITLRLLGGLRRELPSLYDRISAVRSLGGDELLLDLRSVPVRAMRNAPVDRFADLAPVENDLVKRHLRATEIDLRYRDQVIARLP